MTPSFFLLEVLFYFTFKHFYLFFTELSFIYNIVLVSDVQQSNLDFICMYHIVKVTQSCPTLESLFGGSSRGAQLLVYP